LGPDRLVFLDETAANTSMVRRYGWASRGAQCRITGPAWHWTTTTIIAGLRTSGLSAITLLDGPVTGKRFRAYGAQTLVPTPKPDDKLILNNLGAHNAAGMRDATDGIAWMRVHAICPRHPAFVGWAAQLRQVQSWRPSLAIHEFGTLISVAVQQVP
jgi:hypothetical protein